MVLLYTKDLRFAIRACVGGSGGDYTSNKSGNRKQEDVTDEFCVTLNPEDVTMSVDILPLPVVALNIYPHSMTKGQDIEGGWHIGTKLLKKVYTVLKKDSNNNFQIGMAAKKQNQNQLLSRPAKLNKTTKSLLNISSRK